MNLAYLTESKQHKPTVWPAHHFENGSQFSCTSVERTPALRPHLDRGRGGHLRVTWAHRRWRCSRAQGDLSRRGERSAVKTTGDDWRVISALGPPNQHEQRPQSMTTKKWWAQGTATVLPMSSTSGKRSWSGKPSIEKTSKMPFTILRWQVHTSDQDSQQVYLN